MSVTLVAAVRRMQRALPGVFSLTLFLLTIEFFDELHFGIGGAALPLLRIDLGLSYPETGLLLGLPAILNVLIEPALLLLGDTRLRRALIAGGGLAIAASALLMAGAGSFFTVLIAQVIAFPASGAFVTLSQATLMDRHRGREPQMMARWSLFGNLGSLVGPLAAAALFANGGSWRTSYALVATLALILTLPVLGRGFSSSSRSAAGQARPPIEREAPSMRRILANLRAIVGDMRLMRWLLLLEVSDLMLDIHLVFSALYFTDSVGLDAGQVSLVLGILTAAGLAGNLALIPLLERVSGRRLVRLGAGFVALMYAASLLAPWSWAKVALSAAVRFSTLGWYEVLQGEAYAAAPDRAGALLAVNALMGLGTGAMLWGIGAAAERYGLPAAMWLLIAAPLLLGIFTPRPEPRAE